MWQDKRFERPLPWSGGYTHTGTLEGMGSFNEDEYSDMYPPHGYTHSYANKEFQDDSYTRTWKTLQPE